MKGKETKSFLPIISISGTFVHAQKNWATLTRVSYAIFITFKKLSYYFYDAEVTIKCHHALLCKFLTEHKLNSKINNRGNEVENMSHVTFEHLKG